MDNRTSTSANTGKQSNNYKYRFLSCAAKILNWIEGINLFHKWWHYSREFRPQRPVCAKLTDTLTIDRRENDKSVNKNKKWFFDVLYLIRQWTYHHDTKPGSPTQLLTEVGRGLNIHIREYFSSRFIAQPIGRDDFYGMFRRSPIWRRLPKET